MNERKTFNFGQLLTDDELERAEAIYLEHANSIALHQMLREAVIDPAMPRIDERLGQSNDPDFMAYALEYALHQDLG